MAKYNYSKYNVIKTVTIPWTYSGQYNYSYNDSTSFYTSIDIYPTYINFIGLIPFSDSNVPVAGQTYYIQVGMKTANRIVVESVNTSNRTILANVYQGTTSEGSYSEEYSQGSYIGVVQAEDGTYPSNGRHTDGYWYVKGAIANNAPTTPASFTSPIGAVNSGKDVTVSWGASTDADGNTIQYQLEYAINGSTSYTTISTATSTSRTFKIPTGITSITFRVRAYDTMAYSSYRTSSTFQINKLPTLTINKESNSSLSENEQIAITRNTNYVIKITANDEDENDTLQYSIKIGNVTKLDFTPINKLEETTYTIKSSDLIYGQNSIDVIVKDSNNEEKTFNFKINVNENIPVDSSCLANMKFNGYSKTTVSLAELVNHIS